jgi:hypothetical protein
LSCPSASSEALRLLEVDALLDAGEALLLDRLRDGGVVVLDEAVALVRVGAVLGQPLDLHLPHLGARRDEVQRADRLQLAGDQEDVLEGTRADDRLVGARRLAGIELRDRRGPGDRGRIASGSPAPGRTAAGRSAGGGREPRAGDAGSARERSPIERSRASRASQGEKRHPQRQQL